MKNFFGIFLVIAVVFALAEEFGGSEKAFAFAYADNTPPVISVKGSKSGTVDIEIHSSFYKDLGATAFDDCDGDITSRIVTVNPVDRDVLGTYIVTYNVTDAAGNKAAEATRTVNVVDTTAPAAPIATSPAGDYMTDQTVSLSSSDGGSGIDQIYFTLDGSAPDNTKTVYTSPISVDRDLTVKAIAYDKSGNASGVLEAAYGIAPVISNELEEQVNRHSVTITWTTDDPATSRVVYDTASHSAPGAAPNYDYAFSTAEDDAKVMSHSVTITGLHADTKYYYRTVSHGSPEAVGDEFSVRTDRNAEGGRGGGNGSGNAGGGGAATAAVAAGGAATGGTGAVADGDESGGMAAAGGEEGATTGGGTTGDQTASAESQTAGAEQQGQVLGEETQTSGFFAKHKILSAIIIPIVLFLIYFILFRKKKSDLPEFPKDPPGQAPPTV